MCQAILSCAGWGRWAHLKGPLVGRATLGALAQGHMTVDSSWGSRWAPGTQPSVSAHPLPGGKAVVQMQDKALMKLAVLSLPLSSPGLPAGRDLRDLPKGCQALDSWLLGSKISAAVHDTPRPPPILVLHH